MQAGKLRHRITLQEPVKEQNPTTGAVINTWRDVATLWAEVAPLSAREFIAAQASQGEVTTRITIRYRESPANIGSCFVAASTTLRAFYLTPGAAGNT
jgi:SPP1 family predicted phage head-tail adaptor